MRLIVSTPILKLILHTWTSADSRPAENGGDEKATFATGFSPDIEEMIVQRSLSLPCELVNNTLVHSLSSRVKLWVEQTLLNDT